MKIVNKQNILIKIFESNTNNNNIYNEVTNEIKI